MRLFNKLRRKETPIAVETFEEPKSENPIIELDRWYEKPIPHYFLPERGTFDRGTTALVRGTAFELYRFICELEKKYFPNIDRGLSYIFDRLEETMKTGKPITEEFICFGDDRIVGVIRLDDLNHYYVGVQRGPLEGSAKHLEIRHHEQYGGEYPGDFIFSSRAGMIENVQNALKILK